MVVDREQASERFNMRLTKTELRMLERLELHTGLQASTLVKQLIRERYRQEFGQAPPLKRGKRHG